jgi:DNA-binding transcriptional LysR family regulator
MNRNHLALFQAVAAAGSISGGAAAARVSQPAVSRQIAELEDELGVRLLDRLPRGCQLTEAGTILSEHARRWLGVEADAARAIGEYRGLQRGHLTIGASLTVAGYLLPGLLAEFHRRHPQIELKVEVANTQHVQQALLDGTIELGLTEGAAESEELESAVFYQDELVVIAPPGHALLGRSPVTARELVREPLVMREEGSGTRAVVERAFRRRGLKPRPIVALASPEAIKNAVAAGMGLAVVSRLSVALELKAGSLALVPLKDFVIPRPLHRQVLRGRSRSPALVQFVAVLGTLGAPQASVAPAGRRRRSTEHAS